MDHPISHTAAVVGGICLIIMCGCGVLMLQDPNKVYSTDWWTWLLPSITLFTACLLSYFAPRHWISLVPIGVMGLLLLGGIMILGGGGGNRWPFFVILGAMWLSWAVKQVLAFMATRRRYRGFEVLDPSPTPTATDASPSRNTPRD